MEEAKMHLRNKGGRPKKAVRQNQLLGMKCTPIEKTVIVRKAKERSISVSEYLRSLALNEKGSVYKRPPLPKELLVFTGTLNHLAANLNQVAHQRNRGDDLTFMQQVAVRVLISDIQTLVKNLKAGFQ